MCARSPRAWCSFKNTTPSLGSFSHNILSIQSSPSSLDHRTLLSGEGTNRGTVPPHHQFSLQDALHLQPPVMSLLILRRGSVWILGLCRHRSYPAPPPQVENLSANACNDAFDHLCSILGIGRGWAPSCCVLRNPSLWDEIVHIPRLSCPPGVSGVGLLSHAVRCGFGSKLPAQGSKMLCLPAAENGEGRHRMSDASVATPGHAEGE